jgi:hypothetical protein
MIFLSVAFLTFFVGCFLAWLPFVPAGATPQPSEAEATRIEARPERKDVLDGIKPTMRGCGNGYVQGYELSDGKGLGEGNDCHSSFKEAKKEMRAWLGKAEQIIEIVKPAGRGTKQKSERVVAAFPRDEFGNEWVKIMWVHGRCIHWISAPDLEHALAFEKSELNPYQFEE